MDYQYPAVPQRRSNAWKWVVGAVVVLALCAFGGIAFLAAGGKAVDNAVKTVQASETADAVQRMSNVKITKCSLDTQMGTMTVTYTITNTSAETQDYTPQFRVVSGGTQYGEANDFVDRLGAGKTYKGKAIGTFNGGSAKNMKCNLESA